MRFVWRGLFLGLLFVPLALSAHAGGGGDLTLELSLALGLVAMSVLVATAIVPSRIRSITRAFGISDVLVSHRWLGLAALGLVLAHLGFVLLSDPSNIYLLDFRDAPPRAQAATGSTIALALLCGLALARRKLNWLKRVGVFRLIHVALAFAVLVLAGLHVYWLDHLIRDQAMKFCYWTLSILLLLVLGRRWVIRPLLMYGKPFVVEHVIPETPTSTTLILRADGVNHQGLRFSAGQFAWLRLDSPFKMFSERPFTIASGAHRPDQLQFTIRHVGVMTRRFANLRPGRRIFVDGPYGSMHVDSQDSEGLVLIAGGIGITPMMSMLRTLADRNDERHHRLVLGMRRVDDAMFTEEIGELRTRLHLSITLTLSDPHPGWRGPRGYVDAALLSEVLGRRRRDRVDIFICGPPPMIATAMSALDELGVPRARVHTEMFDMV
jgi:3-phenylpropionate/trans-cinnamate dioxygenase ferredoxin reductase subunit